MSEDAVVEQEEEQKQMNEMLKKKMTGVKFNILVNIQQITQSTSNEY